MTGTRKPCKLVNENRCRSILERMYPGHKFPSVRPDFLKNPETGSRCELDGYNHNLRIGFEYNGECHYVFPNHWNRTNKNEFLNYVARDQYKREVCDLLQITLVVIPYTIRGERDQKSHIYKTLMRSVAKGILKVKPILVP